MYRIIIMFEENFNSVNINLCVLCDSPDKQKNS